MRLNFIRAGVAALSLLMPLGAAQAADLSVGAPYYKAPPVVSYYNWTGAYVGINGGYGWGTLNWNSLGVSTKPSGALVGGTVGYNYQVGSWVAGLEGDLDWSDIKGSAACGAGATCEVKNTYLATFRGRIGYAFDRWLPYITGGGAYGNVKATAVIPALGLAVSSSKNELGWTVGGGVEYAFLGNWSAKLEYLYAKENVIRAGLNYKFSGPVFGRY